MSITFLRYVPICTTSQLFFRRIQCKEGDRKIEQKQLCLENLKYISTQVEKEIFKYEFCYLRTYPEDKGLTVIREWF